MVYRVRIWLVGRLLDLAYVIAPKEVRRQRRL